MGAQHTPDAQADWQDRAACSRIGLDIWYPEAGSAKSARKARAICKKLCTVREACLAHAVSTGECWGIWGGHNMGKPRTQQLAKEEHEQIVARRADAA